MHREHKSYVVAIHQPNFFPWLGYFDKMARCDRFVLLDDVQFPETSRGNWMNRVRIQIQGQPAWITMPVVRTYSGVRSVREMTIGGGPWRKKLLRTLEMNYGRAQAFVEVFPWIREVVLFETERLVEFNLNAIKRTCRMLDLPLERLVLQSSLLVGGASTDLLVGLVQRVGGTAYLCGGGAAGYQEDELFQAAGLEVEYQAFQHPTYAQFGASSFTPGLSILDALFNLGFDGTKEVIAGCGTVKSSKEE